MYTPESTLDDDQLRRYLKTARVDGDDHDRLVAFTLVNTGLRSEELAHMTADWVHLDSDRLHVPGAEECTCGECQRRLEMIREDALAHDALAYRLCDLDSSLHDVRNKPSTVSDVEDVEALEVEARDICARRAAVQELYEMNQYKKLVDYVGGQAEEIVARYDGVWWPRDPAGKRTIPLLDATTREYLTEWFETHDTFDLSREEIRRRVSALGDESPLTEDITPYDLRMAYWRRLADLGFSAVEMRAVLGVTSFRHVEHFLKYRSSRVRDAFVQYWEDL